jgi:hypothetical protein
MEIGDATILLASGGGMVVGYKVHGVSKAEEK